MTAGVVLEACGWVAAALNLWGNLALTGMSRRGWLVRLAANALWLAYAVHAGAWALAANHAAFSAVNVLGWVRWSRHRPRRLGDDVLRGWSYAADAATALESLSEHLQPTQRAFLRHLCAALDDRDARE